jgi:hypothetical protein
MPRTGRPKAPLTALLELFTPSSSRERRAKLKALESELRALQQQIATLKQGIKTLGGGGQRRLKRKEKK